MGAGGASLRFSTLEIQPGAAEVTQMTVSTSTEMLELMYSMPLWWTSTFCRHVDPAKCNERRGSARTTAALPDSRRAPAPS